MMFSVIIPSYNRGKVVLRAVNSVLKQTYHDFEIIVVDDGSKDNTASVIKGIEDKRVRYIRQNNAGACVARNTGIENALGQYVSFLDSDDEWFPQMLEKQLEQYQSDSEIGVVYSNLQIVTGKGEIYPFGKPFGVRGYCYSEVLHQGYMAPTSVLSAKRECFNKVGLFDIHLPASQDDDMCFKLSKHYKVGYISEIMASMNVEQLNRISNNPKRVADGWWMLWNKYEDDVSAICGKEIIRHHFQDCMDRYAAIRDYTLFHQAYTKFINYGGRINFMQKVKYLLMYCGLYVLARKIVVIIKRLT